MDTTSNINVEDYGLLITINRCDEGWTYTFTKPATATSKGWHNSFTRTFGISELDVDGSGKPNVYPKTKAAATAAAERFRKWFNSELALIKAKAVQQRFIPSDMEKQQFVTSAKIEHQNPMVVSMQNAGI